MAAPVMYGLDVVPMKVLTRIEETHDCFTIDLDASGVHFEPGQFNMLYAFGVGEAPISISGDPARPERMAHTVRIVGSVTRALAELRPGDDVGVRGPFGVPWPMAALEGKSVVVIAGGIGLAPLRPAIYHLLRHRDQFERVALLYGARTPEDLLFRKQLEKWRARFDMEVDVTVDDPGLDPRAWGGHVGVVTSLLPLRGFEAKNTVALICGPEIMMRHTVRALERAGVAFDRTWVTMERNMKCGVGTCGHCQLGPHFTCKDGPVFRFDRIEPIFGRREV